MKKIILVTFLFMITSAAQADDITEQSFIGKWCGKWDGIYSLCISINDIHKDSMAKYQWLEQENGKFKKLEKKIIRVNLNTLKVDNIYLVLNENNLSEANAMGIFKRQTRMAVLKKEK